MENPVKVKIKSQREGVAVTIKAKVEKSAAISFADSFVEDLKVRGYRIDEFLRPRIGGNKVEEKEQVTESEPAIPVCPTHNVQLIQRDGKFGQFWSCPTKTPDGTWCKWRPSKEKNNK